MKISLVIPAYNESLIIEDTVRAADDYLAGHFEDYELIAVDDGSTDGTAEILKGLCSDRVRMLGYQDNRGKGYAVRCGMLAADGDILLYTDADLAYGLDNIELVARLFEETDADIIIGSRKLQADGYEGYPLARFLASKCFSFLTMLASGMRYDTQCGFKGFRRAAAQEIFAKCVVDGFAFDFEVMLLAEDFCKITQIPVKIINHRYSKVRIIRDSARMLREIMAIKRRKRSGK